MNGRMFVAKVWPTRQTVPILILRSEKSDSITGVSASATVRSVMPSSRSVFLSSRIYAGQKPIRIPDGGVG